MLVGVIVKAKSLHGQNKAWNICKRLIIKRLRVQEATGGLNFSNSQGSRDMVQ